MMTASFHGTVIARSENTVYLEGNHYFPPESVTPGALEKSWLRTLCYWKGIARYYHVSAAGRRAANAAWAYPYPSPLARKIKAHVAFDPGSGIHIDNKPA
ncbi:DUF427 domain-containing protein [Pseudarthrobacter sp. N5]|uniref:DUF427 domain-containing protein n=1 Tax=Pseudarthrobacter sp. N5 TaxID=3418416 RepID=UPI003CFA8D40